MLFQVKVSKCHGISCMHINEEVSLLTWSRGNKQAIGYFSTYTHVRRLVFKSYFEISKSSRLHQQSCCISTRSQFNLRCRQLGCDGWQRSHPSRGCGLGRGEALCTCQRRVKRSWNQSSPHCRGVLFNSHTITVLIMLTWLRCWIMFSLNPGVQSSSFPTLLSPSLRQRTAQLSLSLSVSPSAVTSGIKCQCFDTKAQTQKWFLKGDRAISLQLDVWG